MTLNDSKIFNDTEQLSFLLATWPWNSSATNECRKSYMTVWAFATLCSWVTDRHAACPRPV